MTDDDPVALIRRAIGGDAGAIAAIVVDAGRTGDALVAAMGAVLDGTPGGLERAQILAVSSRDRQVVAIAAAHLSGDHDRVEVLARDHLASYPDSLIVSWIASDPTRLTGPGED